MGTDADALAHDSVRAISWVDDGLELLDQRCLPERVERLRYTAAAAVAAAIRDMVVRGAPAIGITAAYASVLGARARYAGSREHWRSALEHDLATLEAARPTAANLSWAIARMRACAAACEGDPVATMLAEARDIHEQDIAGNRRMGSLGAALIARGSSVLTHCNAGSLATGGYGTALGVIRAGYQAGSIDEVYADETRPWLQGARLTAWELLRDGIPVTLIADGAAAYTMQQGRVAWVVVGADRIAANADVVNKVGTYSLALSARHHGVSFMVVAPASTVDLTVTCGADIPIEMRDTGELLSVGTRRVAAPGSGAWNPVFDVTPAGLIDVIVTDRGVIHAPDTEKLRGLLAGSALHSR